MIDLFNNQIKAMQINNEYIESIYINDILIWQSGLSSITVDFSEFEIPQIWYMYYMDNTLDIDIIFKKEIYDRAKEIYQKTPYSSPANYLLGCFSIKQEAGQWKTGQTIPIEDYGGNFNISMETISINNPTPPLKISIEKNQTSLSSGKQVNIYFQIKDETTGKIYTQNTNVSIATLYIFERPPITKFYIYDTRVNIEDQGQEFFKNKIFFTKTNSKSAANYILNYPVLQKAETAMSGSGFQIPLSLNLWATCGSTETNKGINERSNANEIFKIQYSDKRPIDKEHSNYYEVADHNFKTKPYIYGNTLYFQSKNDGTYIKVKTTIQIDSNTTEEGIIYIS